MRKREDRLQMSLKMLQQHLSEERARVAELHSRLIGRSIQTDAPPCEHANSAAVLAKAKAAKAGEAESAKAAGCPFHQGGAATQTRDHKFAEFQTKFRATSESVVAEVDEHITEQIQQRRNSIRRSSSQLSLQARLESFKDEPPMALASLKELAMDSVQEGVTIADFSLPDQPLVYANHGFELITGYSIEETVGHNCRFLQGPGTEPEKVEHIRRCINAGLPCTVQLKNYRKTGEEFVNYLSLTPIRTARGRVTHYVGIQSDVTELINTREAELDALKKATIATAATEAKSKFLAHMSHEIRTPLNGLIAVGQLLEDTNLNRVQRDYVTTIRSSGETLQALISDILDFSRVEADKLVLRHESFHPQAVIATVMEIVGLHSSRLKLNVGYHVDEGVPESVMGDAMRVQQVLLNTLNNAIKFTEKGDIMIRLYLRKRSDVEAEYQRAMETANNAVEEKESAGTEQMHQAREWREEQTKRGMQEQQRRLKSVDWLQRSSTSSADGEPGPAPDPSDSDDWVLHFYVKDTGIGLSSSSIDSIFKSFQQVDLSPTRKYDGTGLGLAISQRLCEAMGGRMWAESPGLGMGSTFHFCVKCVSIPGANERGGTPALPQVPGGARANPEDAEREAEARRRVRASGADTAKVMSLVRTPSQMTFDAICEGRNLRVLLYDESRMVRQTLAAAMERWGIFVHSCATADDIVSALDGGAEVGGLGRTAGQYDIVVAEKNVAFTKAIRRWAESHGKLKATDEVGGSKATNSDSGGAGFHCPNFVLMTWPNYGSSSDDLNDIGSWGEIGSLEHKLRRKSLNSIDSAARRSDGSVGAQESEVADEDVEEFLSSRNTELLPKPVQHARLQKLLANIAHDIFNPGDTSARKSDVNRPSASSARVADSSKDPEVKPKLPKKMRILLAEDHLINMKVACAVLAKCGHKDVTIAKDGVEVIEKLALLPSGLDSFDIVLMDLHMPRMGGLECVKQLRSLYPQSKVPIVAVTADAVEESRDKCMKNGFNSWISKPFRIEQLEGLLDEFVPGSNVGTRGRANGA